MLQQDHIVQDHFVVILQLCIFVRCKSQASILSLLASGIAGTILLLD